MGGGESLKPWMKGSVFIVLSSEALATLCARVVPLLPLLLIHCCQLRITNVVLCVLYVSKCQFSYPLGCYLLTSLVNLYYFVVVKVNIYMIQNKIADLKIPRNVLKLITNNMSSNVNYNKINIWSISKVCQGQL